MRVCAQTKGESEGHANVHRMKSNVDFRVSIWRTESTD